MKKLVYFLVLCLIFIVGFWYYYGTMYPKMPREVRTLNERIEARNEKLISAQILAQELDLVAKLIDRNLAISSQDSLAQNASLPFLEHMTTILSHHDIVMIALEPEKRPVVRHDYVRTSYNIIFESNFKEMGKFINDLEKDNRLITVEEFVVKNDMTATEGRKNRRTYDSHTFSMKISTLTLIKHS